ncbi:hypothetical protein BV25DRAFT_677156 [Artomyces pyxidatus]|uniref:Uncharacterized protein n=1 Tax=Artomyces pyxidatus TaxID=48021 RepID=A0ACB8T2W1_9AGAM|nr:hypothetical protein BV25DRAFT_677156 [Artomyces pyxidatus]
MELYDKRILHRMLGIAPKAPIVNDNPNANGSSSRIKGSGASSVKSVWEAAERSDDDHHPASPKPKSRARAREDDKEGDDESRYAIPKKRRRLHSATEAHTVFTTDDDEASDGAELVIHTVEDSDDGSLEKEAEEYDVLSSGSESGEVVKVTGREKRKSGGPVKIDRKRAFWAAKGGRGGTPGSPSS